MSIKVKYDNTSFASKLNNWKGRRVIVENDIWIDMDLSNVIIIEDCTQDFIDNLIEKINDIINTDDNNFEIIESVIGINSVDIPATLCFSNNIFHCSNFQNVIYAYNNTLIEQNEYNRLINMPKTDYLKKHILRYK